jgi:hypothetical protein
MSTHSYNINNYNVTISNNSNNNIFINVMNNISSQTYEGTFIKKDIPTYLDIKGFFEFISKCFEQTINYSVNFEVSDSKLLLDFNTILDFMNINHRLILRELILSDDRLTTTKINQLVLSLEALRLENLELKRQLSPLIVQVNEILSEEILIVCKPYITFNKYITELDLSNYNNNNDIVWSNVPKLPKLEKLILNNTKLNNKPPNAPDTICALNQINIISNHNHLIMDTHRFEMFHFNNIKHLEIKFKEPPYIDQLGPMNMIPNLESLTLTNFLSNFVVVSYIQPLTKLKKIIINNCKDFSELANIRNYIMEKNKEIEVEVNFL